MSALIRNSAIALDEVLGVLSARTSSPSTMGAQLEQAEANSFTYRSEAVIGPVIYVRPGKPSDSSRAQERVETQMLKEAGVIRCLDALARLENARFIKDHLCLVRLHRAVPSRTYGELTIQCLRAFEEWKRSPTGPRGGVDIGEQYRALVAVYQWAREQAPDLYPVVLHDSEDLVSAFRFGKAPKAVRKASDLYADCYLLLKEFLSAWNRRQVGQVA